MWLGEGGKLGVPGWDEQERRVMDLQGLGIAEDGGEKILGPCQRLFP